MLAQHVPQLSKTSWVNPKWPEITKTIWMAFIIIFLIWGPTKNQLPEYRRSGWKEMSVEEREREEWKSVLAMISTNAWTKNDRRLSESWNMLLWDFKLFCGQYRFHKNNTEVVAQSQSVPYARFMHEISSFMIVQDANTNRLQITNTNIPWVSDFIFLIKVWNWKYFLML